MRRTVLIMLALIITSCTVEDDYIPETSDTIFVDNPESILIIDIIYVSSSTASFQTIPKINESHFINKLNGNFFHRHGIGFALGEVKTIVNDELYDLRDNVDREAYTFLKETKNLYKKDRLSVFIIKRANTYGIAGIGKSQRVLLTDEKVFTSTAPHEIGHALGLFHIHEAGNIMSFMQSVPRTDFNENQVDRMVGNIGTINSF